MSDNMLSLSTVLPPLAVGFGASFVISLAATAVIKRAAPALGLVDQPNERKIHRRPIPLGGGVAMFLGFWAAAWAGVAAALMAGRLSPQLSNLASGVTRVSGALLAIAIATLVLAGLGLWDDRRGVRAWVRLGMVMLIAALLALTDDRSRVTLYFENLAFTTVITVLWVAGVTCAFMVLDNMDGLCAGVAFIVSLMFLVVAVQTGQYFLAAAFALLMGALAGFLVFNFPPASVFMGDCGSMFLGFLIAILSVRFTYFDSELPGAANQLFPAVVPLLILAVPLFDIASVTWIRLRQGRSPFSADTRHFSHRLVALGMTHRQAVLTIYLVTAAIGLGATVLYHTNTTGMVVAVIQALAVFAIIVVLETAGQRKERKEP